MFYESSKFRLSSNATLGNITMCHNCAHSRSI